VGAGAAHAPSQGQVALKLRILSLTSLLRARQASLQATPECAGLGLSLSRAFSLAASALVRIPDNAPSLRRGHLEGP